MVLVLILQVLQGILGLFQDVVAPDRKLLTKILPLPLVHERLFFGRPVDLALVLGRSVGRMDAVVAVLVAIAMAVVPVVAIAVAVMSVMTVGTVVAIYAIDRVLILHFDPTLLERASLLAGASL